MDAYKKLGMKDAIWCFVIGDGRGKIGPDLANNLEDIKLFITVGGNLSICFGGAAGPYVEATVTSPQNLYNIFDMIVRDTGVTSFMFDIEGAYIEDTATNSRRTAALKLLKAKYPKLTVSYILPANLPDKWGNQTLPAGAISILKESISVGVDVDRVIIMTMDWYAPTATNLGQNSVTCAQSLHTQLTALYPSKTSDQIYNMIGILPMIGENDDGTKFTLSDVSNVCSYANLHNVGLVSYWSQMRDQVSSESLSVSSKVNTKDFEFYNAFKTGLSSKSSSPLAPLPTPPTSTPTTSPSNAWTLGRSYKTGDIVTYDKNTYTCTADHIGVATPNLWKPSSTTTGSTSSQTTSSASNAVWSSSGVLYKTGQLVTYNGMTYKCLQNHTSLTGWDPVNVPALWSKV